MKVSNLLSVAFFAAIGGSLRYELGQALGLAGTIIVNLVGCFALAFLTYYLFDRQLFPNWLVTGLGTGLIGAFTTFSTFSLELVQLLQAKLFVQAGGYFLLTSLGGSFLAWLGYVSAQKLRGRNH